MNIELGKRSILVKRIESMSDSGVREMLAYTAGYEAGKTSTDCQYTYGCQHPHSRETDTKKSPA